MTARVALLAAFALLLLGSASAASGPASAVPHVLMVPALHGPQALYTPNPQSGPPPTGPALPTIQDGIGPGSAMQQGPTPGQIAFICTAAFLLRDPNTATYYLATAGHCVVRDETDPHPYTGAANPDKVDQEVDICVAQCLDNALGLGTYVKLSGSATYQPVAYGESGGPGQDFGIVQIPADQHGLLRPWMPQFGGPTGTAVPNVGDTLVHYGHGSYCCPTPGAVASRTPLDQGRVAVSLGVSGTQFTALGSSSGGDSGSPVAVGQASATRGMQGAGAVGVLTHGLAVDGVPYYLGTTLQHGLDMVRKATGLSLQLVLQDDPLTAAPQAVLATAPNVAIRDPVPGATVRPGPDGTAMVAGTAGLGNRTPPPGALVQLAVDDPAFGPDSRVPVLGNDTWSGTWDLHGVGLGMHTLYARLVGTDGAPMAAVNETVTVAAPTHGSGGSSSGSPSPSPPSGRPHGGADQSPAAVAARQKSAAASASASSSSHGAPLPTFVPLAALGLAAAAQRTRQSRRERRRSR